LDLLRTIYEHVRILYEHVRIWSYSDVFARILEIVSLRLPTVSFPCACCIE
jgi:hypothetical protein